MRGKLSEIGFLLILAQFSCQMTEQVSPDYYTAAVVEYSPTYVWGDALKTLTSNADAYIKYIEEASKQNADIIVFPEDGLTSTNLPSRISLMDAWTTAIPSPLDEYVPCTGTEINISETLKRLSCAARRNRIYVVVNIAEKELIIKDTDCSKNGTWHYYNSNVVFDRTGKVIARYRKVNLYMEPQFDNTEIPEIVTFDTDFGERFGTFICFDILFAVPALNLTRIEGVSNIVYPTAWFSETPFLTAPQTQFGWSYAENVNLLVAGYHDPEVGNAGSGIYLGRNGIANVSMTRDPEYRLLISRVPKTKHRKTVMEQESPNERKEREDQKTEGNESSKKVDTIDWIRLLRDNVKAYRTSLLKYHRNEVHLMSTDFRCEVEAEMEIDDSSPIRYNAVYFDDIRKFGTRVEAGVRLCGLVQCLNNSVESCGFAARSNTTFSSIKVTATFLNYDYPKILAIPNVLDYSFRPFDDWSYVENTHGAETNVTITLNKPMKNLIAFGIYSRFFDKDRWN
ncbi:hypothetical protein K0M31_001000 [Melipona bicolor]|uniref:CN hydrolase domain-containing protein n=1 Tax=Melipona bicolor TaxID=60889 RepID=A0AA40GFL0_9HYME|nr:hypothetical protein K0M31_001000 [Melipona bicolor]